MKEKKALNSLNTAETHKIKVREAVKKISDVYHPVDLETGKLKDAEEISDSLNQCFDEIETVAAEATLSDRSLKRIKKARNVLVDMVATIIFFHFTIQRKIRALCLPSNIERIMYDKLIPAFYLSHAADKAKTAEARKRIKKKSEEIIISLQSNKELFSEITKEELKEIEDVAEECATLFQRSSSCVEGRNGQLSLRHHSLHRLSDEKLAAQTIVHNFSIKRRDGTTAAERFFDAKPKDLFNFLLNNMNLPVRPARKRKMTIPKKTCLTLI